MLNLTEIKQLSQGIDHHLRQLESFVPILKEIKLSLDNLLNIRENAYLHELGKMQRELSNVSSQLKKYGLPIANEYELELEHLKEALDSDAWPVAVPLDRLCNDVDKKKIRASNILDLFVGEHLKNKKFLDYGCGSGEVVFEAAKREAIVIGYDIKPVDNDLITSNFEDVYKNAPYDIILVHDVLDHIENINPIQALRQIREILSTNGKIYIRNHPWSSRHGGNLHNTKNKAFMHLVFDEIELARIGGYCCDYNIRIIDPIETYRYWFNEAGLEVKEEFPITCEVENFFFQPSVVTERIKSHWPNSDTYKNFLEIEFIEYILESKEIEDSSLHLI